MSEDRCREFDQGLLDPRWAGDPEGLTAWLSDQPGLEGCIAEGLRRSSASDDWLAFEHYLLAAYRRPSRDFTPELCAVLARQMDDVNNEDIVDVLAEVADPAAVECLEEALWWQPPSDEYRQLAIKCVWALAAIGTSDALRVLRDAASSEAAPVREAAERVLRPTGA
jgi:hypothetical protein